jgi:phosphatidylglycerol---prolipoprotein diacylglyceryl transferase
MIHFLPSRAIALQIGGFAIHWYGLLYLAAFLLAFALLPRLQKFRGLAVNRDDWASILSAAVLGVIVGGRLGYVLFYAPQLFTQDPLEILKVWHGGMASHGGFIGVTVALLWILHRKRLPLLAIADVVVVPIALGLALGRVGNFINQELYGTVTSLPWAISIPGVEGLRHPTQIYAVVKDLSIAGICFWHLTHTTRSGRTFALFLILYGALRFLVEFLRVQEYPLVSIGAFALSRGQLLTIPVFLAGLLLLWWLRRS